MLRRATRPESPADAPKASPSQGDPLSVSSRVDALEPICEAIFDHVNKVWAADPCAVLSDLHALLGVLVTIYKRAGARNVELAFAMMEAEKAVRGVQFKLSPEAEAAEKKFVESCSTMGDPITDLLAEFEALLGKKPTNAAQQASA